MQSVTIPAHATTTNGGGNPGTGTTTPGPTPAPCSAPMGCYEGLDFSFAWPGGSGVNMVNAFGEGPICNGPPDFVVTIAVASSLSEAAMLLNLSESSVSSMFVIPALPTGCNFYSSNSNSFEI